MNDSGASLWTACPRCAAAVDPLRSRFVRVVSARVVAYCSAACSLGTVVASGIAVVSGTAPASVPAPIEAARADVAPRGAPGPGLPDIPAARLPRGPGIADKLAAPAAAGPRSRRWRRALALLAGAGFLSMVMAVWASMRPARTADAVAEPAAVPAPLAPAPAGASVEEPVARAKSLLGEALAARAGAIRLPAASLLAGLGDGAALDVLAALAEGGLPLERLGAAEALAAAGDTRGVPVLAVALASDRRDLRLEAARALARVGEPAGAEILAETLSDKSRGLGAAEALAALDDRRGVAALETALGAREPERRMRAALALGRTGHMRAEPVLREILADGRYQNGAASALAGLGATDVEPKLLEALGYSALRVDAAHALRKLGRRLDAGTLAALSGDLDSGDDIARLSAAQAILVLAASVETR